MKRTERRITALERTDKREPIIINIHTTIIGMDGKVERVKSKTVRMCKETQA